MAGGGGLALGGALATIAGLAVVVLTEVRLRRCRDSEDRPRLSRPILPSGHRHRALRTFRGWAWAGGALLIAGGAILLAWTLGAGIGIVRAFDPPERER